MHQSKSTSANTRSLWGSSVPKHWLWSAAVIGILLNFAALLFYQYYAHGDFPRSDEWVYLHRLSIIPDTGFLEYVFGTRGVYDLPTDMIVWFAFYKLLSLNILFVRVIGAAVTASVAGLLCVMLYRKAAQCNFFTLLVVLCAPFIIFSGSQWETYEQSIESVMKPLSFGMVLLAMLSADNAFRVHKLNIWCFLSLMLALVAIGIYPTGLAILPASVGAYLLLSRRVNASVVLLGLVGLALGLWYVIGGGSLTQNLGYPGASWDDLSKAFVYWLDLTGDAVFTPLGSSSFYLWPFVTGAIGCGILIVQCMGLVHVMHLPEERRADFLIPVALTAYNLFVFIEILFTRFHYPNMGFVSRYAVLMMAGPVSVLFYAVMTPEWTGFEKRLLAGALLFIMMGTALADGRLFHRMPFVASSFQIQRLDLINLSSDPVPDAWREMVLNKNTAQYVYSDLNFLKNNHLALYRDGPVATSVADMLGPLKVDSYGPDAIKAGTPFNLQPDGASAMWLNMNRAARGSVYVIIDDVKIPATIDGEGITFEVPAKLFIHPGRYPMHVEEKYGQAEDTSNSVDIVVH